MSYGLVKTDKVSIIGDSLTSGYIDPRDAWPLNANFLKLIKATWINPPAVRGYSNTSGSIAGAGSFPTFSIDGHAGRAITDVSGSIMSNVSAGSTKVIIQLGVNDAFFNTSNPTLTTAVNQIHTDLVAGGVTGGLWIGPFAHGEKWPSGAGSGNDIDVAIDRVETLLASMIPAFVGWDYVSWRTIFNVQEPIRNPSNLASGIFTTDGTHPRYQDTVGMGLLVGAVLAKIGVS